MERSSPLPSVDVVVHDAGQVQAMVMRMAAAAPDGDRGLVVPSRTPAWSRSRCGASIGRVAADIWEASTARRCVRPGAPSTQLVMQGVRAWAARQACTSWSPGSADADEVAPSPRKASAAVRHNSSDLTSHSNSSFPSALGKTPGARRPRTPSSAPWCPRLSVPPPSAGGPSSGTPAAGPRGHGRAVGARPPGFAWRWPPCGRPAAGSSRPSWACFAVHPVAAAEAAECAFAMVVASSAVSSRRSSRRSGPGRTPSCRCPAVSALAASASSSRARRRFAWRASSPAADPPAAPAAVVPALRSGARRLLRPDLRRRRRPSRRRRAQIRGEPDYLALAARSPSESHRALTKVPE